MKAVHMHSHGRCDKEKTWGCNLGRRNKCHGQLGRKEVKDFRSTVRVTELFGPCVGLDTSLAEGSP